MSGSKGGGGGKGSRGQGPAKREIPGQLAPGGRGGKGGFRVPSLVMVPLGLAVGWFVADWSGAIFGGILGILLWRSRT